MRKTCVIAVSFCRDALLRFQRPALLRIATPKNLAGKPDANAGSVPVGQPNRAVALLCPNAIPYLCRIGRLVFAARLPHP